jgi:hypothetical protein
VTEAGTTATNSVAAFDDGQQLGVIFETATPFDTPCLMTELMTWFNAERDAARLHPLLLIGIWVVVFLEIHPFAEQGSLLPRVTTDARHNPHRGAELATLSALLPASAGRAGSAPQPKSRAREAGAGCAT